MGNHPGLPILTVVVLLDYAQTVRIFIHIDERVGNPVFAEELFGSPAVLAPGSAIHRDAAVSDIRVRLFFGHDRDSVDAASEDILGCFRMVDLLKVSGD